MKENFVEQRAYYPKQCTDWMEKTGGYAQGNMTLRDHFAAQAMTTMFYPALMESIRTGEDLAYLKIAEFAYQMADVMLKERAK